MYINLWWMYILCMSNSLIDISCVCIYTLISCVQVACVEHDVCIYDMQKYIVYHSLSLSLYIYICCVYCMQAHIPQTIHLPGSWNIESSCQSMQWAAHLSHLAHGWLCRCAATGVSSGAQPSWRATSATWCSSCTPVRCFLLSEFRQQYLLQKQPVCFWIDHSTIIICHGLTCHGWCLSKLFLVAGLNT